MPNNLVFNNVAKQLKTLINGVDGTGTTRQILTDTEGRLELSTITVTAEDFDIRPLTGTTDSITIWNTAVTVTAEDFDIRPLTGTTDSITIWNTAVTVTAEDFDIRPLTGTTDSITIWNTAVTVTAEDFDIRPLTGTTDSITIWNTAVTVTAEDFDIRPLTGTTDSITIWNTAVTVTAEDFDIRPLSAATDSVRISGRSFTESSTTIDEVTDSAAIFIHNTGEYSLYSFYLYNTGENTVTVQLQISPTTTDSYFMNDISGEEGVPTGEKTTLVAAKFLQYTRLFYETSGATCTFDVFYNAQV